MCHPRYDELLKHQFHATCPLKKPLLYLCVEYESSKFKVTIQAHKVKTKGTEKYRLCRLSVEERLKKRKKILKADDQGEVSHAAHQLPHGPPELPARLWLL
jgi:hypothetical protein